MRADLGGKMKQCKYLFFDFDDTVFVDRVIPKENMDAENPNVI